MTEIVAPSGLIRGGKPVSESRDKCVEPDPIDRWVEEQLHRLPPMTDADRQEAVAILATVRPDRFQRAGVESVPAAQRRGAA